MAKRLYGLDPIERFNQKYVIDEMTGCWLWIGTLTKIGYGRLNINKKFILAHRFSYEYFKGPLIKGLVICHNCKNRKCVNPEHLRQDTLSSNSIDMVKIKNQNKQILSYNEVIEIKKALKHYYFGQIKDLSNLYKVDSRTISSIKNGITWSHIEIA